MPRKNILTAFVVLLTFSPLIWALQQKTDLFSKAFEIVTGNIQEFHLSELFGVSHPSQLIDFDLNQQINPQSTYLVDQNDKEIPYQLLSNNKIVIQTDLPAGATKQFFLKTGRAPMNMQNGVTLKKTATYYEITNGLTGIRVPLAVSDTMHTPAPVQGVLYRDGTWSGTGPNYLYPSVGPGVLPNPLVAKTMDTSIIEEGPLKTVIAVSYTFTRPDYRYGSIFIPRGEGHYKSTIEVQAGQPSIMFLDDTDMDLQYSFNLFSGLEPDIARWRGYEARSIDAGYQYDTSGNKIQYTQRLSRSSGLDAYYDLKYDRDYYSDYRSYTYPSPNTNLGSIARLSVWNIFPQNTGWYWEMYHNTTPSPTNNLLGIFAGKGSDLLGAYNSGPGFYTKKPSATTKQEAGITFQTNRRSPDNRFGPHVVLSWGLFVGNKSSDLLPPDQIQPIGKQMNLHSGINLNTIAKIPTDYPDPPQGYGGIFMDKSITDGMIQKIRQDPNKAASGRGYPGYLLLKEPTSLDLINMWQDNTTSSAQSMADKINATTKSFLSTMVNGDGVYDWNFGYWKLPLGTIQKATWIDQLLGSNLLPTSEKAKLKADASLMGHVMWNDDFSPMTRFASSGATFANENMPYMMQNGRNFFALLLSQVSTMKTHTASVVDNLKNVINEVINPYGADSASVHYNDASFGGSTLNSLLQLRMQGQDLFKSEDKLTKYANYYMNFLTPPEARFGGRRKMVAIGDGSTEGTAILGRLATGFTTANPDLSAQLTEAWKEDGKKHENFFGSTLLMINEDAKAAPLSLGSATFPGWYSVLRNSFGTENENALWFINGTWYRDHRHADQGSILLYALSSPLSLDWGSTYSPQVPGSYMHNMIVREKDLRDNTKNTQISWDQDNIPVDAPPYPPFFYWTNSQQAASNGFLSLQDSSYAQSFFTTDDGLKWTRSVLLIHPNANYPIILLHDSFEGTDAASPKISTLNLMADGVVQAPAGPITPILRTYKNNNELPSNGQAFPLQAGLNKFSFTGQSFGTPAKGIDWDLYTYATESQQALIGNWAHNWNPDSAEFQQANGKPFEERQDILRIKGNGPFTTIILPYKKGQKRADTSVTQANGTVTITSQGEQTIVNSSNYYFKSADKTILTTFDMESAAAGGYIITGGPTEIAATTSSVTITAHGSKGQRQLQFPGNWNVPTSITKTGAYYIFDYQSNAPQSITLTSVMPTLAPTPTSIPAQAITSPTSSVQPTPTSAPGAFPTATLIPTPSFNPNATTLSLSLLLHGLGKSGDDSNPNAEGNLNPTKQQRKMTVELFNNQNKLVMTKEGLITFDPLAGDFKGTLDLGTVVETGMYTVKVKSDHFLKGIIPGIVSIIKNKNTPAPQLALIAGDVNNDNSLNILDYNLLMDCFSDLTPARNCSDAQKKQAADLTDDGSVNQFDYNLFLRELSNRWGE